MAVTVAALNATHFLLAGEEHPRGWTVVAYGTQDALMKKVGYRDKRVSIRSTVGGSVRADQAALIEALTAIVSVPEGSGGGGDVDPGAVGLAVNDALKGSPQPIEGQVALPSDVVNAIGSAVNAAIRDEGALPVAGAGGASAADINNALKASAQPTRTQVSSSQMIQVQTAANGTSWASFPVAPCQTITIYNQTGVRIRVGLDSSPTIYTVLEPDMGIPLATPNNSSNVRVKRDDESTTQVTVTALAVL